MSMESEEEELKQKKLEELQQKLAQQQEQQEKQFEKEAQIQSILKRLLEENARERLNNVRIVNHELYMKAVQAIMTIVQKGYVKGKLNEEQVKEILGQLKSNHEIKITRK